MLCFSGKGCSEFPKRMHFCIGILNYDKSLIHLPRHSSFTIMQGSANLGIVRQNMEESLANTTISTTKAHGNKAEQWEKLGEILSSKRLLRD